MSWVNLYIRFHGFWQGLEYIGGEEVRVTIPSRGISYSNLVQSVHDVVDADMSNWRYVFHCLLDEGERIIKHKIQNDYDVQNLLVSTADKVIVFVTLKSVQTIPNTTVPMTTGGGFVHLMTAQHWINPANVGGECSKSQGYFRNTTINPPENIEDWGFSDYRHGGDDYTHDHDSEEEDPDYNDNSENDDNDDSNEDDNEDAEEEVQQEMFERFCTWLKIRGLVCGLKPQGQSSITPSFCRNVSFEGIDNVGCYNDGGGSWRIPGDPHETQPIFDRALRMCTHGTPLGKGAIYMSKDELKIEVGEYHLNNKGEYRVKYSDTSRYHLRCKHEGCSFVLNASGKKDVWTVFKFRPHSCQLDPTRSAARTLPSKVIGAHFAPRLLEGNFTLSPKDMMAELKNNHGLKIRYNVALRAKSHAIAMIYGDENESFKMLPSYIYMLKCINPGSVAELKVDEQNRFQYVFFALAASISGFRHNSRPVFVIDGTHLKGKYRGIMFVAVTLDGNDQIFPLGIGIGDKEDDASWTWFLRQLRDAYGCPTDLLIVSDGHKSIGNAVRFVFPEASHGLCCYHLQQNIAKYGANIVGLFNKAAYAYRVDEFDKYYGKIGEIDPQAFATLYRAQLHRWARCKCSVRRYNFMNSNAAESFNSRLLWARRLPICSVLEVARTVIEQWFYERRRDATSREDVLTKVYAEKVGKKYEESNSMRVFNLDSLKFRVMEGRKMNIVDLALRSCSCLEFQHLLIPCSHAVATIRELNHNVASYTSAYYSTENLQRMWAAEVNPIPEPSDWRVPDYIRTIVCDTPNNPRQAGRPRTRRYPSAAESSSRSRKTQVCSRCGATGHNRTRCTQFFPMTDENGPTDVHASGVSATSRRAKKKCGICRSTDHTRRKCPRQPDVPENTD